jgi:UDP-glucose 4-epimerase
MRMVITGGSGFIGSNLAARLLELGHDVSIYDLDANRLDVGHDGRGIDWIVGNVLDLDDVERSFRKTGADVVVHLAALRNLDSQQKPFLAHSINSTGLVNVLEAARVAGVKRVVYASSAAVYGSAAYYRSLGMDPFCVKEWMPPRPYNVYGATKLYNEHMATQYMQVYGINTVGLRVSIVVGPGKKAGSKTSEFNDIIEAPVRDMAASISSYGDQKVNIIFVNDVVHGFVRACIAEGIKQTIYNLGGYIINTKELVATVKDVFHDAVVSIEESDRERAVASAIDSALARDDLGYEPLLSLRDAIRYHNERLAGSL